jgi:hypothetical protein
LRNTPIMPRFSGRHFSGGSYSSRYPAIYRAPGQALRLRKGRVLGNAVLPAGATHRAMAPRAP